MKVALAFEKIYRDKDWTEANSIIAEGLIDNLSDEDLWDKIKDLPLFKYMTEISKLDVHQKVIPTSSNGTSSEKDVGLVETQQETMTGYSHGLRDSSTARFHTGMRQYFALIGPFDVQRRRNCFRNYWLGRRFRSTLWVLIFT